MAVLWYLLIMCSCFRCFRGYDLAVRSDPSTNITAVWTLPKELFSSFHLINITFGEDINEIFSCSPSLGNCNDDNATELSRRVILVTDDDDDDDMMTFRFNDSDLISRIGFILPDVSVDDAGIYHLVTTSGNNITQYELLLYIYQKPTPPYITGSLTPPLVGESHTLTCTGSESMSEPAIYRNNNSQLVYQWTMDNIKMNVTTQMLTLAPVRKKHNKATFTCAARDGNSSLTSEFSDIVTLNVLYIGNVTLMRRDMTGRVLCLTDCNPPCTYKWFDEYGVQIHDGKELDISMITGSGNFTCQIRNNATHSVKSASTYIFHDKHSYRREIIIMGALLAFFVMVVIGTVVYIVCTRGGRKKQQNPLTMTKEIQTDVIVTAKVRASGIYDVIPDDLDTNPRYQKDNSFSNERRAPVEMYGNEPFQAKMSVGQLGSIPECSYLSPASITGTSPQNLELLRKKSVDSAMSQCNPEQWTRQNNRPKTQDFIRLINDCMTMPKQNAESKH